MWINLGWTMVNEGKSVKVMRTFFRLKSSTNWDAYFIIYVRPISCNKPVKYKEDKILFGRFIT